MLGDLVVDHSDRTVTLSGRPVKLTATEYRLLFELAANAGRVLTYDELRRRVWGTNRPNDRRTLRTHLSRLRRKLGEEPGRSRYILAEPRIGYRIGMVREQ